MPGNNLDLVRFTLAAMVFVSHCHDLSGLCGLAVLSSLISSTLAVQAFFVISGFLIFRSYDRSSTLKSYAAKRIRRILPAYAVVVVTCAFLLGLVGTLPYASYLVDPGLWRYLAANLLFLNFLAPELPGVFGGNPIRAVNGALWTLKIEVAFYVAVPICAWLFRRIGRTPALVCIYLTSAAYGAGMVWLAETRGSAAFLELARQLPGQMTYFVAGAAVHYGFDRFRARPVAALLAGAALYLLSRYALEPLLRPLGVALLVMGVAFGPHLGRFGRYGDFSYGIYIVHFPILQLLVALGLPQRSPPAFLICAVIIVMSAAVLSWHQIEKRFLRYDSYYRQETVSAEFARTSAGS